MSSPEVLLKAIETAAQDELAQLGRETQNEVEKILAEAQAEADVRREVAYTAALEPIAVERARRRHEAWLKGLTIIAAARDEVTKKLQAQIEVQLKELRTQPHYPASLQHLIAEAIEELGQQEMVDSTEMPHLAVDARDEAIVQDVLESLSYEMNIVPELTTWGGVIVRSGDGRITVTNTLEARLQKLRPYLPTFITNDP